ncbi:MAG: lamin tail domain-containing protein [Anaerolineae bacterium]
MRRIALLVAIALLLLACGGSVAPVLSVATKEPTATPPPHALAITAIQLRGSGSAQPDEYVEIANVVDVSVDLSGWRVVAGDEDQYLTFASGFVLAPGEACRLYTNQVEGDSCGGQSFGYDRPIWDNSKDCGQIYDGAGTLVAEACRKDGEPVETTPTP